MSFISGPSSASASASASSMYTMDQGADTSAAAKRKPEDQPNGHTKKARIPDDAWAKAQKPLPPPSKQFDDLLAYLGPKEIAGLYSVCKKPFKDTE